MSAIGNGESVRDFERFFLVNAKEHVEVLFKIANQLQSTGDIFVGPLLRISKVEENLPARSDQPGTSFFEEAFPNFAHVRNHGPVDKRNQIGAQELLNESFAPATVIDIGPGD